MSIPADLQYTATHEWLRRDTDGVTIGITDHAQSELTDVVFVDLPEVGRHVEAGDELCSLESVKAVAYIYAPISGTVSAVNEKLRKEPELINKDPYGEGWITRIAPDTAEKTVNVLDAEAYQAHVKAGRSAG
jgi:glycine cleavage system H protein